MTFPSNGGEFVLEHIEPQHARKQIIQSYHSDRMRDNIPWTHHSENFKLHNNVINPPTKRFRPNYSENDNPQAGLL